MPKYFAMVGSKGAWQRALPGKRRLLDKVAVCAFASRPPPSGILSSSAVERSAVNRLVVGSNPTSGANSFIVGERACQSFGIRTSGFVPEGSGDRRSQSYLRSQQLYRWRARFSASPSGFEPLGSCRSAAKTGAVSCLNIRYGCTDFLGQR